MTKNKIKVIHKDGITKIYDENGVLQPDLGYKND